MWSREIAGLRLTFHLAGINNQNFIMRDEETGSYWQQISGLAIAGPMAGQRLTLVHSDELLFATWKSEEPRGTVLLDVAGMSHDYAPKNWDARMKRVPVVIDFHEHGLKGRDLMLGIQTPGASRAFPYEQVIKEKLVKDHVGADPVLLVVGPDGQSVRAFRDRLPGRSEAADFYRRPDGILLDASTGSEWNFRGCAISGAAKGACLEPVETIKDYWFDWRNYHPATTVYGTP